MKPDAIKFLARAIRVGGEREQLFAHVEDGLLEHFPQADAEQAFRARVGISDLFLAIQQYEATAHVGCHTLKHSIGVH